MPHRIEAGRLGTAVQPAPLTDHLAVSALEKGHRAGDARDPQRRHTPGRIRPQSILLVPRKPAPAIAEPGRPEAARHPAPGAAGSILRRWGFGEWDHVNTGAHGELVVRAEAPAGTQVPYRGPRGNTFRLPPQPWDAAQVIGYQPQPDES